MVCFFCADSLGKQRPDLKLEDAAAFVQEDTAEATELKSEVKGGAMILRGHVERPQFQPAHRVARQQSHGIEIYEEFGLVGKSDWTRLVGVEPDLLGVKPFGIKHGGPEAAMNVFIVRSLALCETGAFPHPIGHAREVCCSFLFGHWKLFSIAAWRRS